MLNCFPSLIIGLASVVVPTIGWRWLIRIASIPGIILIMAFKVMKLVGSLLTSPLVGPVAFLAYRYLSHAQDLSPLFKYLSLSVYEKRVFWQI